MYVDIDIYFYQRYIHNVSLLKKNRGVKKGNRIGVISQFLTISG